MGGSSPGGGGQAPPQAQPIDFAAVMAAAGRAAERQTEAQFRNMVQYYPAMERQQLQSASNVGAMLGGGGALQQWREIKPTKKQIRAAKKKGQKAESTWVLDTIGEAAPNEYTAMARGMLEDAMAQRGVLGTQAAKLSGIGDWVTAAAARSYGESGPTSIESRLYADAERELALGRSLSPEEIRDAQQSARAAFAARGLGTSMGSSAAEILNRDAAGRAREADRRQFAAAANQQQVQNVMARRDQAAQQAALGSGILGNSAQTSLGAANLGLAGMQGAIAIDPVQRALAPGLGMGSNIQGTMGNMITPTYGNATNAALGVAGFNTNMAASNYNAYQNLQGARMAAGAQQNAGMMGMFGGIGGGLLAGAGFALSDKREKKDIKPLGKTGSLLGLTAYEYKYKGDDTPRVGFMAQEVKKVLPEAVSEVDYKGKKRLAIKPGVIGAALAGELMAAKAA
jgi:hypothetical protein